MSAVIHDFPVGASYESLLEAVVGDPNQARDGQLFLAFNLQTEGLARSLGAPCRPATGLRFRAPNAFDLRADDSEPYATMLVLRNPQRIRLVWESRRELARGKSQSAPAAEWAKSLALELVRRAQAVDGEKARLTQMLDL